MNSKQDADVHFWREGYKHGLETGYANGESRRHLNDWIKLFWVVFAASFLAFASVYLLVTFTSAPPTDLPCPSCFSPTGIPTSTFPL